MKYLSRIGQSHLPWHIYGLFFFQTFTTFFEIPFPITPSLPFNDFVSICSIRRSVHIIEQIFSVHLTVRFPRITRINCSNIWGFSFSKVAGDCKYKRLVLAQLLCTVTARIFSISVVVETWRKQSLIRLVLINYCIISKYRVKFS